MNPFLIVFVEKRFPVLLDEILLESQKLQKSTITVKVKNIETKQFTFSFQGCHQDTLRAGTGDIAAVISVVSHGEVTPVIPSW